MEYIMEYIKSIRLVVVLIIVAVAIYIGWRKRKKEIYNRSTEGKIEQHKENLKHNPKDSNAYMHWAVELRDETYRESEKKKKFDGEAYQDSLEKFAQGEKLDKHNHMLYYEWGVTLSYLAEQTQNPHLYYQCIHKLRKSLDIQDNITAQYMLAKNTHMLSLLIKDVQMLSDSTQLYQQSIDMGFAEKKHASERLAAARIELGWLTNDVHELKKAQQTLQPYVYAQDEPQIGVLFDQMSTSLIAILNKDEKLLKQSISNYLNTRITYYGEEEVLDAWGARLHQYAILTNNEALLQDVVRKKEEVAAMKNKKG